MGTDSSRAGKRSAPRQLIYKIRLLSHTKPQRHQDFSLDFWRSS